MWGDTINTGEPLVGFEGEADDTDEAKDSGTVVGTIPSSEILLEEKAALTTTKHTTGNALRATPKVRALARRLGVDLNTIETQHARITEADVHAHTKEKTVYPEQLSGVRRAMILSMKKSHAQVVPVTLMDDADITDWKPKSDFTLRVIRAMQAAIETVPMLNAYFDPPFHDLSKQ